ncbi:isoprenylcysteine carboxylmethyltransferase family protein [uncultured Tateyamaria sp.]|uniref:methyltransferase family protein n=1 Tax=uncultured Tateyamaria sp. TaxID=455651 RepID=UPI002606DBC5|nr:PEMT/PEM2 methyltransferase family protein [uncultured Tateyamaria sp.]
METGLSIVGLLIALSTLSAILWSIARPSQRLWPPIRYTALTPILIWVPTFVLFGALVALGVLGWGELAFPRWFRFGIGIPLILLGNIVVWSAVAGFGIHKTGGAVGGLETSGLYRFSRNPQYVSDIAMVLGWMALTAAPLVMLLGFAAIIVLIVAPFSEEPWLRSQYGSDFDKYAAQVRRYL